MTTKIGLDISMNSTGMVINHQLPHPTITYHKIIPKKGGKHSTDTQVHIYHRKYNKETYSEENISKIISAEKLAIKIKEIINNHFDKHPDYSETQVIIEGGAFGSFGGKSRLADMTIFSALVKRKLLTIPQITEILIIPPTTLKKHATGKGNAKKQAMEDAFIKLNPDFDLTGKNDDLIDAYFLTTI